METSLLDILASAAGAAGYALDTPGAHARGLLAGEPGERRSGRELLEAWGILGENEPGLDAGDVAGFATEMVVDPLAIAGPVRGLLGSHRVLKGAAKSAARNPAASMFGASELERLLKGAVDDPIRQLDETEMIRHYEPWQKAISPHEEDALKAYQFKGTPAIQEHYRQLDPDFSDAELADDPLSLQYGPTIRSMSDVEDEIIPFLESGVAKGSTPYAGVVYRKADPKEIGLDHSTLNKWISNPETIPVGEVREVPGLMSTSVSPNSSFYGTPTPDSVLLDIHVPEGTQSAFYPGFGKRFRNEHELALPPGSGVEVMGVKEVPIARVKSQNVYRPLDKRGRPIPVDMHDKLDVFNRKALNKIWKNKHGEREKILPFEFDHFDQEVPEEWLVDNWRELIDSPTTTKNVLLKLHPPRLPEHSGMRRLTGKEFAGGAVKRLEDAGQREAVEQHHHMSKHLNRWRNKDKQPHLPAVRHMEVMTGVDLQDLMRARQYALLAALSGAVAPAANQLNGA